jgi:hypothetical protein
MEELEQMWVERRAMAYKKLQYRRPVGFGQKQVTEI